MSSFEHQPDLPTSPPASAESRALQELRQQYGALRVLLNASLAAMLVFSLALNLFLGKQMRLVRSKARESRPVVQRLAAEFNKKEPSMQNFVSALQAYAVTHPDFHAVLSKYTNAVPQYFANPVRAGGVLPRGSAPGAQMPVRPATKPAGN